MVLSHPHYGEQKVEVELDYTKVTNCIETYGDSFGFDADCKRFEMKADLVL